MELLKLAVAVLAGISLYLILCDIFRVSTRKMHKAMRGMQKQLRTNDGRINTSLEDISLRLSKLIHLGELRRSNIAADLMTARMPITPEQWIADALVRSVLIGIVILPLSFLWQPAWAVAILMAVMRYRRQQQSLRQAVMRHREALEQELPRMVFTIEKALRHDRNVVRMLESYQRIAGPDLQQELNITLADMRSGSQETAVTRLEMRVGSVMMSDVCRGLLSVLRGDDTASYWLTLGVKFSDHQRNILKARADRIPDKIGQLSLALVVCYVLMWLGTLILQVVQMLPEIF